MYELVLSREENKQFRAQNEKQKKKRAKKRSYIATGGVLTVQEKLDLSQNADIELGSSIVEAKAIVRTRAPLACSVCRSLAHNARTCPERQ
jgi:hypothetical protein